MTEISLSMKDETDASVISNEAFDVKIHFVLRLRHSRRCLSCNTCFKVSACIFNDASLVICLFEGMMSTKSQSVAYQNESSLQIARNLLHVERSAKTSEQGPREWPKLSNMARKTSLGRESMVMRGSMGAGTGLLLGVSRTWEEQKIPQRFQGRLT
jgi:hypothetical protein